MQGKAKLTYRGIPKPPVSPLDLKIQELEDAIADFTAIKEEVKQEHTDLQEELIQKFNSKIEEISQTLEELKNIDFTGPEGRTPVAGVDFPLPKIDKEELVKEVLGKIKVPKDGKSPVVDVEAIAKKASSLVKIPPAEVSKVDPNELADKIIELFKSGKKQLSLDHIGDFKNGLEQYLRPIRSLAAGFRGGGDTVIAGTNISITTDTNGKKVISTSGTGDVVGPASSVSNNVVFFNGTTGKIIKDSGLALSGVNTGDQTTAGDLTLARTGASTYSTVQHLMDFALSSGRASGGTITSAATANQVDVAAGTGFIKATDSDTTTQTFFNWSASAGVSVPSNTTRYIGVQYNSGTPNVVAKTADTWDLDTEFPLGVVVNEGGTRYIFNLPWITADNTTNIIERFDSQGIKRDERLGGLILANTGTRNVTVSAGAILARMSEINISAIDTSGAGTFDAYYRDGASGWTKQSAQTQVNNTQYDNGSGTLASITALAYASRWFYLCADGTLVMLYGRADYTALASALNDPVPSSAPDRITKGGLLIGRFIYQASGTSPASTQTAFGTAFTSSGVTSAADLSNGVTGSGKIVLQTSPTITTPIITQIVPGANFTLKQNSVNVLTSEETGAIVDTLYLKTGKVGIGTTPSYTLDVTKSIASDYLANFNNTSSTAGNGVAILTQATTGTALIVRSNNGSTNGLYVGNDGKVGIGTLSPGFILDVQAAQVFMQFKSTTGTNSAGMFAVNGGDTVTYGIENDSGNSVISGGNSAAYAGAINVIGAHSFVIATNNTGRLLINSAGDVRMTKYAAGTATFDASGNITSVSDERFKDIQGAFAPSLNELLQINPIIYKYNKLSNLDQENVYAGFSAQNVMQFIPEAIGKTADGYYSINDRPILAAVINALKELTAEVDELRGSLPRKSRTSVPVMDESRLVVTQPTTITPEAELASDIINNL